MQQWWGKKIGTETVRTYTDAEQDAREFAMLSQKPAGNEWGWRLNREEVLCFCSALYW